MARQVTGGTPLMVVGGGMAEWPQGEAPHGRRLAPVAFVDASERPQLLELPALFACVGFAAWRAQALLKEEAEETVLSVRLSQPRRATFALALPGRYKTFIDSIKRLGILYICPTTPALGISARLAKDHSFPATLDRGPAAGDSLAPRS